MKSLIAVAFSFVTTSILAQPNLAGLASGVIAGSGNQRGLETAVRTPLDLHSTRVVTTQPTTDPTGATILQTNASYVEMATGLNYLTTNGVLQPSLPEFELINGAAIAWRGQTKVSLGATLDSAAPIQIRLPDGQLMSSRVHGVALYDAGSGQSVLVSEIREGVQGVQIAANQIIYPDCLEGPISGDLKYTIRLDGVEQDLVIRQADVSAASLQSLGFQNVDPANVTIETWSEFLSGPDPVVQPVLRQNDIGGRAVSIVDQDLQFGSGMRMAAGRSFVAGQESDTLAFVSKQWVVSNSRRFLVESVPVSLIEANLPAIQPGSKPGAMKSLRKASRSRMEAMNSLPNQRRETRDARIVPLKSAAKGLLAWLGQPGLVLDYATVSGGLTNYTFAGDTTYYLSSATTCYGTNTWMEGGAVLKYANNATLTIKTPLTWKASSYRPAVLCAVDDRSAGATISGSGTSPGTNWYAATALILDASTSGATNTAFNLAHLRVANANTAVQIIQGTNAHSIKHAQFVNCGNGIAPSSTTLAVYNALFVNVRTNFIGSSTVGDLEHLTMDGGDYFQFGSTFSSLGITNSIIAGVTNVTLGAVTNEVAVLPSNSGVFQNLSLGTSHYLPTNSPYRSVGTTGINPTLAGDLIDLVTTAPVELGTNYSVGTNLPLTPQLPRNTEIPDLGYHEYALDYIAKGISVSGTSTLSLLNGVAVGFYGGSGITPGASAKVSSFGLPESLNRLTQVNTVFEQPQAWYGTSSSLTLINGPGQNLRFTDVSFLAQVGNLCPTVLSGTMNVQDCQLRGVYWQYYNYTGSGSSGGTISLRNSLLERCTIDWNQGYVGTPYYLTVTWQNNLFTRCSLALTHCSYYYGIWGAYDNLFDTLSSSTLTEFGGGANVPWTNFASNGYVSSTRFLNGTGDVTGLSRDFVSGPLGDYYYPTNSTANSLSTLINADTSTNRTPATSGIGLYQYTTTLDQVKEAGTALDIGMHLVALENHRASLEFSGTQGLNNWFYQRSTTPLGTSLVALPNYGTPMTGQNNTWYDATLSGADTYAWIWSTGQHPGLNYDTVRMWQSPAAIRASFWGTAANTGSCPSSGNTDGTRVLVQKNTTPLTSWIGLSTNMTAITITGKTYIQTAELLRFQLNDVSGNGCDATTWDPLIVLHRGIDSNANGIADWFEDSNGDGVVNTSDGLGDFDGDGVIDRLDGRPFDPTISLLQITIDQPANGSSLN